MLTLLHFLKQIAEKKNEAEAIVLDDKRVTYGELWEKVNIVARYLKENGLRHGDRIAMIMKNSPEYVVVYYGILAAGGVVVSLNAASKFRDLSNWVSHCGANWLFADFNLDLLARFCQNKSSDLAIVVNDYQDADNKDHQLDSLLKILKQGKVQDIEIDAIDVKAPASIIYTSGTTGQPKGVTLTHENITTNIISILDYLKLVGTDSIVNVLPFYYSYGNSILHTHLAVGAKIILVNSMMFPNKVIQKIEEEGATGFSGVPSTFALLLHRSNINNSDLSSIRYMTQAGGAMPVANIERLLGLLPDIKFFVMYGQTEASARLSYLPPAKLKQKIGSVGIAIPGVSLEVRDKYGSLVKQGEIGEIFAKGKNIMKGYWSDPELTKAVIIDGWLKTGDLAHYDEDGYLYITGRASEMIKVGDNRISPKDIEEVISELDSVEEVAVIGVVDELMGQVPKAFIVEAIDKKISQKEIQAFCKENLATYKIPKYIEKVECLPKTASGKVQKYLLN